MREDARRRFAFGITSEDTMMRFWFTSRSAIAVSESFNFMTVSVSITAFGPDSNSPLQDPAQLIRMVNFLTYASEEDLGYDLSMSRKKHTMGQYHLIIGVGGRQFQTVKVLADFAADSLLGRGTRVWEGFFIDEPEKPRVLKDVWVENDRELEGDVLKTLRKEYHKLGNTEHKFDDYFLTMAAHGKVQVFSHDVDDTLSMMNGQELDMERVLALDIPLAIPEQQTPRSTSRAVSSGMGPNPQEVRRIAPVTFRRRIHYRITFKEVAKPLYTVVDLEAHFKALKDTITGA